MSTDQLAVSKTALVEAADVVTDRHLAVCKTFKLFIGGKFPRSESGRTYPAYAAGGGFLANAALGSRKDVRDAVVAARKGFAGWSAATPYNRGQVIYRIAEMLEGRRSGFVDVLVDARGLDRSAAAAEVDASIDRLVHYAGWTDKLAAVFGSANPVSGPYFSYSAPEPTGVVGIVAPQSPSLLGLVSVVAPVIAGGNACVVIAAETDPCTAISFAEVLATSDVPGGVVNILTGGAVEMAPHLAAHADVNALDLTGAVSVPPTTHPSSIPPTTHPSPEFRVDLERAAADTLKRVFVPRTTDFAAPPGTARLRAFLEIKTVWHPTGALSLSGGTTY